MIQYRYKGRFTSAQNAARLGNLRNASKYVSSKIRDRGVTIRRDRFRSIPVLKGAVTREINRVSRAHVAPPAPKTAPPAHPPPPPRFEAPMAAYDEERVSFYPPFEGEEEEEEEEEEEWEEEDYLIVLQDLDDPERVS